MHRLDFVLPDFTRFAWTSDAARDTWAPRLSAITAAWLDLEWRAVEAGVRRCAIATASPDEYLVQAPRWADAGLTALPLEMLGVSGQPYSATPVAPGAGQPFVFRFVVGRTPDVVAFKAGWDEADDEVIGSLLGYPRCCREFFRRTWVDESLVDTTWPMAVASMDGEDASTEDGGRLINVAGPPEANILWRWMGVRAVPHLPCRFDCPATVDLAEALLRVGHEAGFGEEMGWLLEILRWPVEWSALHGIAEVKTPVLRVSTRTDATAGTHVVRRHGDSYPAEGADGLGFPYRAPGKLRITGARGFKRGIENVVTLRPVWYAADNGFSSVVAMNEAHQPVVEAAVRALGDLGDGPHAVVDLGCGNGALLAKVADAVPGIVPFGVDSDPTRLAHATELHPGAAAGFVAGDLFDLDSPIWVDGRRYALAILMPGRLTEVPPTVAAGLRAMLAEWCDRVVVYAYGDWLDRFGSLAGLAAEAGFSVGPESERGAAIAGIVGLAAGES